MLMNRSLYLVTGALVNALLALSLAAAPAVAQSTTLASVATDGTKANGYSVPTAISGNGRYVAFDSTSNNIVDDDANNAYDVFVRDTQAHTTIVASVATDGTRGNSHSLNGSLSADGRYVAFYSFSSNLVDSDANNTFDVFVRDTQANTTTCVSVTDAGPTGDSSSILPSISGDGRYVVFSSGADNLVPGDTNFRNDVFVRDTVSGTTNLVSVATDGTQGNGGSPFAFISADGRYVAFESEATNLVPGDTNGQADVFLRDTVAHTTVRVSIAADGTTQGDGMSGLPAGNFQPISISADGRYVAFESDAANLVDNDTNGKRDIFVRDTVAATTVRASIATAGTQGNETASNPSISADGRYLTFTSAASNLVDGDANGAADIFVRDLVAQTTRRVSSATDGTQANANSTPAVISADGEYVAFGSDAANLVPGDANLATDAFVRGPLLPIAPTSTFAAAGTVKSSPTAVDGMVYFGDDGGRLHAVNTTTGAEVSGFPVNLSDYIGAAVHVGSRPAVYYSSAGEFIYLTTTRGDVCRVAMDGSSVFHYSDFLGSGNVSTPAVTSDGAVYVGLTTPTFSSVFKLNANLSANAIATGLAWAGSTISSVSVAGSKVYVGFTGGSAGDIVVLNAADLTPLSSGVATGEGVTAPPYVVGQDMYVGTLAGNFYKLNSSNNNPDVGFGAGGKVAVAEPAPTSPFFSAGAFFAGSAKGRVWRIGLNGSLSIAYDTGVFSAVGGVVVAADTLAFGTGEGLFYKVPLNGDAPTTYGPFGAIGTTPTRDAATGRFFAGSDDGSVYGF
jgi:Tol biopolymer transport system component